MVHVQQEGHEVPLFGHPLNFRDPEQIPLEFHVLSELIYPGLRGLSTREPTREDIASRVQHALRAAT